MVGYFLECVRKVTREVFILSLGVRGSHSSKNCNRNRTYREIKEAVSVRTFQIYTTVSCPRKKVHVVHN